MEIITSQTSKNLTDIAMIPIRTQLVIAARRDFFTERTATKLIVPFLRPCLGYHKRIFYIIRLYIIKYKKLLLTYIL